MLNEEQRKKAIEITIKLREVLNEGLTRKSPQEDFIFISQVLTAFISGMSFSLIDGDLQMKKDYLDTINLQAKNSLNLVSKNFSSEKSKAN